MLQSARLCRVATATFISCRGVSHGLHVRLTHGLHTCLLLRGYMNRLRHHPTTFTVRSNAHIFIIVSPNAHEYIEPHEPTASTCQPTPASACAYLVILVLLSSLHTRSNTVAACAASE